MHHIFVDKNFIDNSNGKITIEKNEDKDNFNHLARVLRVKEGEKILCSIIPFNFSFDYQARICAVTCDKVIMDIEGKVKARELPIRINLYQGLPKSDKLEFIIEKAVELGVYSIIPVENEFSVARMEGGKVVAKLERFNKISKSAAEQSKRNIIPKINEPISFDEMLNIITSSDDIKKFNILFYENAEGIDNTRQYINKIKTNVSNLNIQYDNKSNISNDIDKRNIEVNVIIGTEGGFSENEIKKAKVASIEILSLGERILRTETAAVTALSILAYELQNLGDEYEKN